MSFKDIYSKYNIDVSQLKKCYPLNDKTELDYDDIKYLYIDINMSKKDIINFINLPLKTFETFLHNTDIRKSKKLSYKNGEKTCLEKYGVKHFSETPQFNEKVNETCLKKYGKKWYQQTYEAKERNKQTCLKKYGVISTALVPEIKEKQKATCLQKYGAEHFKQSLYAKEMVNDITIKQFETRRKNKTFNTSSQEKEIFNALSTKFIDIKTQYKSELYPFHCDFYIPFIDTYIEYQGHWSHGGEPYIGTKEQNEKVKLWENKNTKQYNGAINVWTYRDPLKRKTAKENNLNWIEFFNMEQFNQWFKKEIEFIQSLITLYSYLPKY